MYIIRNNKVYALQAQSSKSWVQTPVSPKKRKKKEKK
jgi:hypothetical protein